MKKVKLSVSGIEIKGMKTWKINTIPWYRRGTLKPPLNTLATEIYRSIFKCTGIILDNSKILNAMDVEKEIEGLFTFRNLFSFKIYKIKYWIWRKLNEKK